MATRIENAKTELMRIGAEILPKWEDEPWNEYDKTDPTRWDKAESEAEKQAEMLRDLATIVQAVGIPIHFYGASFRMGDGSIPIDDLARKRRFARAGARLINAVGHDLFEGRKRNKIVSDSMWGMELDLDESTKLSFSVVNESTCEQIPILDEEGAPVFEEREVFVSSYVTQLLPKTKKKCITLFGPDADEDQAS